MDLILILTRLNTQLDTAMVDRSIDKGHLSYIIGILLGVSVAQQFLFHKKLQVGKALGNRIRTRYLGRTFEARARLDVLSHNDPIIRRQLISVNDPGGSAWGSLQTLIELFSTIVLLVSQVSVLFTILSEHNDGFVIAAIISFSQLMLYCAYSRDSDGGSTYTDTNTCCLPFTN